MKSFVPAFFSLVLLSGISNLISAAPRESLKCHKKARHCVVQLISETCKVQWRNRQNVKKTGYSVSIEALTGKSFFGNGVFNGVSTSFSHDFGWGKSVSSQEDACSDSSHSYNVGAGCTLTWWHSEELRNPVGHSMKCPDPDDNYGEPVKGNWG